MKKVLIVSAFVLASGVAFSQTSKNVEDPIKREERAKDLKDKMAKELNLSENQIKQINAIDDKYKSQEESLHAQAEAIHEKRKKLREDKKAEIDKIFTEEQKLKLKDMKDKYHGKKMHHSDSRKGSSKRK
ncbi:hypothetical protein O2K51_02825 [Apibacter raozihei]|uniref:hypothetical protein n=1 Tax=Apibacter raozihei TaxID=2500547 RepID=UPI000FE31F1E|nr:hypothetical protein [Apibacter raozihei]